MDNPYSFIYIISQFNYVFIASFLLGIIFVAIKAFLYNTGIYKTYHSNIKKDIAFLFVFLPILFVVFAAATHFTTTLPEVGNVRYIDSHFKTLEKIREKIEAQKTSLIAFSAATSILDLKFGSREQTLAEEITDIHGTKIIEKKLLSQPLFVVDITAHTHNYPTFTGIVYERLFYTYYIIRGMETFFVLFHYFIGPLLFFVGSLLFLTISRKKGAALMSIVIVVIFIFPLIINIFLFDVAYGKTIESADYLMSYAVFNPTINATQQPQTPSSSLPLSTTKDIRAELGQHISGDRPIESLPGAVAWGLSSLIPHLFYEKILQWQDQTIHFLVRLLIVICFLMLIVTYVPKIMAEILSGEKTSPYFQFKTLLPKPP